MAEATQSDQGMKTFSQGKETQAERFSTNGRLVLGPADTISVGLLSHDPNHEFWVLVSFQFGGLGFIPGVFNLLIIEDYVNFNAEYLVICRPCLTAPWNNFDVL